MTIEIESGLNIYRAAQKACREAKYYGQEIDFTFNGIKVYVHPYSFDEDIVRIYYYLCEIQQLKEKLK
jgi:hypothetical protein